MDLQEDKEFTLGTGKLLGLFFGLVALCAVFFGLGYSVGRSSTATPVTEIVPQPTGSTSSAKPSAVTPVASPPAAAQPTPVQPESADEPSEPVAPTPEVGLNAVSGYIVQVAAVGKQQDAEALVTALRKKQYAAFVKMNAPIDPLYHVQIGPFADLQEADAVKARLISDGYNPIVKR